MIRALAITCILLFSINTAYAADDVFIQTRPTSSDIALTVVHDRKRLGLYINPTAGLYRIQNGRFETQVWMPNGLTMDTTLEIVHISSQAGFICAAVRGKNNVLRALNGSLYHVERTGTYAGLDDVAFERWEEGSCSLVIEPGTLSPPGAVSPQTGEPSQVFPVDISGKPNDVTEIGRVSIVVAFFPVGRVLGNPYATENAEAPQQDDRRPKPFVLGENIVPTPGAASVIWVWPNGEPWIKGPLYPTAIQYPPKNN